MNNLEVGFVLLALFLLGIFFMVRSVRDVFRCFELRIMDAVLGVVLVSVVLVQFFGCFGLDFFLK